MQSIISENLTAIADACRAHRVKELYVFGSAVREDFSAESDVDFLTEFLEPANPDNTQQLLAYYENMDSLEDQLRAIVLRNIDLIQERAIKNKYLRHFINEEKKLIYAAA